jgi:twitching motility protein PilI
MQMHAATAEALPPLLTPTAALLRGFELAPVPDEAPRAAAARRAPIAHGIAASAGSQAAQGFRIGSLGLMIDYADGSELTELPPVYRLPNAPAWLLGMANLHGMLVPVFDLALHFGLEHAAPVHPMLLVLAHGRDAAGIVIEGLPERLRWQPEQIADAATVPEALAGVVQRPVLIGEQLWFDLDCSALLAQLEQALVARQ